MPTLASEAARKRDARTARNGGIRRPPGRPHGIFQLTDDEQLWLSEVWDDPTMRSPDIADRVGLSKSGLHRYKTRLALPDRKRGPGPLANLKRENRKRRVDTTKAQLARCAKIEAAERLRDLPRWRRCDVCLGLEDTTHPHAHKAA